MEVCFMDQFLAVDCYHVTFSDVLNQCVKKINYTFQRVGPVTGIKTGYKHLDSFIAGLRKGELTVIASRPGVGKTTFAMNIAANVSVKNQQTVAIISFDRGIESLMMQLISSLSSVSMQDLCIGKLDAQEWSRLTAAINEIKRAPLTFVTCASTLSTLGDHIKRLKQDNNPSIIVIDYLQLISVNKESHGRESILRKLKLLARELDVSIIILSQLDRRLEKRSNKRPRLSDFRDSDGIEYADAVLFIYRDESYNVHTDDLSTFSEVIVAKQPNDLLGSIPLAFVGEYCRFENAPKSWWAYETTVVPDDPCDDMIAK
jgi:replicative DNA helicase